MFKKLYSFLFGTPKKSTHIIEPAGGIDGMSINKAILLAQEGYKIRRMIWPKNTYLTYNEGNKTLSYYRANQLIRENWNFHWSVNTNDFVSCDWITDGKVE